MLVAELGRLRQRLDEAERERLESARLGQQKEQELEQASYLVFATQSAFINHSARLFRGYWLTNKIFRLLIYALYYKF